MLLFRRMRRPSGGNGPDRQELGRLGEEVAARYLVSAGWRLVGRNLRAPEAELDLVGRDGDVLVVVEVKTGWLPESRDWRRWRPGRHVRRDDVVRRSRAARRIARGTRSRVDIVEVWTGRGASGIAVVHLVGIEPDGLEPALRRPPRPVGWP